MEKTITRRGSLTNLQYFFIILCGYFLSFFQSSAQTPCPTIIEYGKNIVCNGDFELKDYCFTNQYTPFSQSPLTYSTPGYYLLGNTPSLFNAAFSGSNHTPGGNTFLMVDGSCTPNMTVWKQTVNIIPNTNYFFSAWLSSLLSLAPAQLQFSINGVVIGSPFSAPGTTNTWTQFTQNWFSGSLSGPIVIEIINLTTAGCNNGNDFGIDDISFIPGCKYGTPGPQPNLGPDIYLCPGSPGVVLNSGLSAPYTNHNINWSTGEKTPSITVTKPGLYSVCVDSAGSCTRSDVIEVIAADKIKANLIAFPISGCSPLVVWAKNSTKGAPLTFQWYVDGVLTPYTSDSLPSQTFTATGPVPVIHTIKLVAKNQCGNSDDTTVNITVYPPPQINAGPDTSICNGESVQLKASGGGTYSWSPSNGLSCTTCANPIANPGYTITYTVNVVNSNGCKATDYVTITILYNLNLKMRDTTVCAGKSVVLNTGINNGTSYNWSPSTGLSCTNCANPVASPTATTTYNVNVSKGSCNGNGVVTVNIKSCGPGVTATGGSVCPGACASVSATGSLGTPPYTFSWLPNAGTGSGPHLVCPSQTTTYTVIITDQSGQTNSTTAVVNVLPSPQISSGNAAVCPGSSAILTASGASGNNYTWSPSTGLNQTTGSSVLSSPVQTTSYTVTGASAQGCINSTTIIVSINPVPVITATDLFICKDSAGVLSASGGQSYTWYPGSISGSTFNIQPTTTGVTTYTVCGSNTQGCTNCTTVKVTANDCSKPSVRLTGGTICAGSCFTLNAQVTGLPPFSYTWTPAIGNGAGPHTVCPSQTTTYTVIVSDNKGDTDTTWAIVTVNPIPVITAGGGTICEGTSITVNASGGSGNNYTWIPGMGIPQTGNPVIFTPTSTTTYTVIGADNNSCSSSTTIQVTVKPAPVFSVSNAIICQGETGTLTASGPTSLNYTWQPTGQTGASLTDNPTLTTTYTLTGEDSIGCRNTAIGIITVQAIPVIISSNTRICNGKQATLTASGAGTNNYTWQPTGSTGPVLTDTPASSTTYTVTGASSAGCTNSAMATVTVDPLPVITATNQTICQGTSITVSASGGSGNNYTWISGAGIPQAGNPVTLSPGSSTTYTITGADANACINSTTVLITVNPAPVFTVSSTTICQGQTGILSSMGSGALVSYTWQPTGQTNSALTHNPSVTTTYTLTGEDSFGCRNTGTGTITVQSIPVITANSQGICFGKQATLTASGAGTTNYTWLPAGQTGANLTVNPTVTTTYTVIGASSAGCTNSTRAVLTVNSIPIAAFEPDTFSGCAPLTVSFKNNTVGLINSNCQWYFGDTGPQSVSNSCTSPTHKYTMPGNYSVTLIVSSNGCPDTLKKTNIIHVYPLPTAGFTADPKETEILQPIIHFTNTSSGDSIKTWDFGDGITDNINNPIHTYKDPGRYDVCLTVKNNLGCTDNICQTIIVKPIWSFYIPNAFTPNGDGKNDTFNGAADNITEYKMYIYDRWGNLVFESNSLQKDWDGKANGGIEMAQQDVYAYLITFKDVFGKQHKYAGGVTLVR